MSDEKIYLVTTLLSIPKIYISSYGHYPIQCKRTNLWNAIPEDLNNTKSQYGIKKETKKVSFVTTVFRECLVVCKFIN